MPEERPKRAEPYSKPPRRQADPRPAAPAAIIAGAVLISGSLLVFTFLRHDSAARVQAEPPAPASAEAPAPASPVLPAPAPAPVDAATRFKSCKPYAGYEADTHSASVSARQLLDEASCLCALAGAYTVRLAPGGIQQFKGIAACPAGSAPMPLAPDAKQWKGEWIDEPGHQACVCSTDVRELKPVVMNR
jgi:hypothetical protein